MKIFGFSIFETGQTKNTPAIPVPPESKNAVANKDYAAQFDALAKRLQASTMDSDKTIGADEQEFLRKLREF